MLAHTRISEGALFYLKESNLNCDLGNRKALGKACLNSSHLKRLLELPFISYLTGGGGGGGFHSFNFILDNSQVWP